MRLGGSGTAASGEADGALAVAALHDADVGIGWQCAIEHCQRVRHLLLQAGDEGVRVQRLAQGLVVGLAAHCEVGRQIIIRIAVAIGASDPDLLAAHPFAHGLEDVELVADAVDAPAPLLVAFEHQLTPTGPHHPADGHDLLGRERARLAPGVPLEQRDCLDHGTVRLVVGAELEGVQQGRQQAAIV
jgi:hypothetical protein